ncbi:MAG: flagellar biosynthesis protein FlgM [Candidatus Omnitrophica bacterium]|nr:flagellar biosynthesis protein FlgM [Candidatus Omnitrophota bacterium]
MKGINLPNIWKEGQLFASSGLEGRTDWYHPFVASTLFSPGALLFHTYPERKLIFSGKKIKNKKEDIVTSDFVFFSRPFLSYLFLDKDTIIGQSHSSIIPEVSSGEGIKERREGNSIFQFASQSYTVLLWKKSQKKVKFTYAFDSKNIENALSKAKKGLKVDFILKKKKKLSFFKRLTRLKFPRPILERTYYKAFSVLKVNIESPQGKIKHIWTTPDRFPHKDMWFWDSAFHALGNRYISSTLAEDSIKAVLQLQRKDGFVAFQMNPEKKRASEEYTQPPLLAWASYNLYCHSKNKTFLRYVYPRLKKYLLWLYRNRDKNKDGLLEWKISPSAVCKGGETGMDNSPRFDRLNPGDAMAAIDLNSFVINEMEYLERMAQELNKKGDIILWHKERKLKKDSVNSRLWSKRDRFYYDLKENGKFNKIKTISSFLPLFAGIANKKQAQSLVNHLKNRKQFWSDFPIPSVSMDEPSYCKDMWRGPTWINYNYLIIEGLKRYGYNRLAHRIINKTLKEIARWYKKKGAIFEYYDSEGETSPVRLLRKEWLGGKKYLGTIKDYHWSAALYIALANFQFK